VQKLDRDWVPGHCQRLGSFENPAVAHWWAIAHMGQSTFIIRCSVAAHDVARVEDHSTYYGRLTMDQRIYIRIKQGLQRDRHLSTWARIAKGARLFADIGRAKLMLRNCDSVGPGTRVEGQVLVENLGQIVLGSELCVRAGSLPIELLTGSDGQIEIGDRVWLNFGCVVAAKGSVRIGSGVMIGQHCIISDVEVPESVLIADETGDARPISIGNNVWLAGRVTVMPGVTIGENAVITAGSIVASDVPADVVAGGNPARVIRSLKGDSDNARTIQSDSAGQLTKFPSPSVALPSLASGAIIADFTIEELADELRLSNGQRPLQVWVAPYGQVTQNLLADPPHDGRDFAIIWTRPEASIPAFSRVLSFEDVDEAELTADVDAYCALIQRAAAAYRFVFVPTWVTPYWIRGRGLLDTRKGGVARAIGRMNQRLMQNLEETNNAYVLNAERWYLASGRSSASQRGWYLGKIAIPRSIFVEAARDIKAGVEGLMGLARKLLILDLDDTLWGGIVGDLGWEALRLGGHDSIGEAFADFQRAVKELKKRGVILGIVSKNEESVALEAIRHHPEMVLREVDFVGWKINWTDKAKNVADLAAELNLGLQSVVFIDDNPIERARVREALPEVLVPEWPEDKLLYPSALMQLSCFDTPALSREDAERTKMYADERQRQHLQQQVGSLDEWLMSLGIKVSVERVGSTNIKRAAQLLNKTNQMNLRTRRMSDDELNDWASADNHVMWTITVSDRFGDAGLTGLVGMELENDTARIVDFVLSCRVMGRKVEECMVHLAVKTAQNWAAKTIVAEYAPTSKNKPCLSFWQTSGFRTSDNQTFTWDAAIAYALPAMITLEMPS